MWEIRVEEGRPLSFGRYDVVCPIGEGGMAQVYLCIRRGAGDFQKKVVLKVLHSRLLGNETMGEMFLEEARLLARLGHPNIVAVHEVERIANVPYLVMEYVNGPTYHQLRRHVGRPDSRTLGHFLHILQHVCDGLHFAHTLRVDGHSMGLVHRDVSSQNIVIDAATGTAKLIDFGIAKATDTTLKTQHGMLKGKLAYMAPEVLAGRVPDVTADVYSIGVLLYWTIVGRVPYPRSATMSARTRPPILEPEDLAGLPAGLEEVLERTLAADPGDRYPSALDVGAALQGIHAAGGGSIPRAGVQGFIAEVFPRGEADWQRPWAPSDEPHEALGRLTSTSPSTSRILQQGAIIVLAVVLTLVALASALILVAIEFASAS